MAQWQMTPRTGDDVARYRTAPQRQPPSNAGVWLMGSVPSKGQHAVVCQLYWTSRGMELGVDAVELLRHASSNCGKASVK